MKKLTIVSLVALLLFLLPSTAFGLNSPGITQGHGIIIGKYVTEDVGLRVGAEYGFTRQLGILAEIGDHDYSKVACKYQLNSQLALLGGIMSWGGNNDVFLGVNGATSISKTILGMGEIDIVMADDIFLEYQLGVKYNLTKQVDLRGGILGSTVDGAPSCIQIGVGYKF